jgi:hypothetical protein
MIRRREFVAAAAGAAASALAASPEPGSYTARHVTPPDWYWRGMRWLTMNLVQDDPGKVDLDFWLDYLKRAHVDAASWNSGGIIAFYPTKIPHHRRNDKIGSTDPLGYLVEGCRKMGLIVTLRVDHHATYSDTAKAKPEWISRDANGRMHPHWAAPDLFLTCTLGPYNEDFMTSVMVELETMYRCDGFNHNRWAPQRMCFCDWCRTSFRKATGLELPAKQEAGAKGYPEYLVWRENRIFELWDHWNASIRRINPNAFVLPGIGSERDRLNMSKVRARAKTLYLDYQGRSGLDAPWMAGKKGREMAAVLGHNPAGITFSVGVTAHRWKDSVQSGPEIKMWVCDGVAHGLRPKMAKFAGTLYDRRWLKPVEELYTWLAKAEPYLRNEGYPVATVGILHSQATARFYSAAEKRGYEEEDASKGFYHAMVEARIPTDTVHEDLLAESDLSRFRVLVLPTSACLSDRTCEQLRQYVAGGGSLVAFFESSLYNEVGQRRKDFALADLFGVSAAGPVQGPMKNSYLRFSKKSRHPVLRGFEDADRAINGMWRVPVRATAKFSDAPVLFVEPYPDLPMEEVYPRDYHKNVPELYLREIGRSRIAYVPFDLERSFWEILDPDHGRLLSNIVRWAAHEDVPVAVEGRGVLDVTVWRQKSSMAVHLVNLTNPMLMKGPARELIPVGEQRVRVKLPHGANPKSVRLLAAGTSARAQTSAGFLDITVPTVELHEIVAIDL